MPGRYSHSVVLAGYSSQGIISLPNDKHVEYLRASPFLEVSQNKHASNARLAGQSEPHQRSQSALAVRSGRWTPVSDSPVSPTQRTFINGIQQQPAPKVSKTRDAIIYRPRKSIDTEGLDRISELPPRSKSVLGTASEPVPQLPARSAQRPMASNVVPNIQQQRPVQSNYAAGDIRNRAANAAAALLQKASERRDGSSLQHRQPDVKVMSAFTEPTKKDRTRSSNLRQSLSNSVSQRSIRGSIQEQDEPDFDGFSDVHETSDPYFSHLQAKIPRDHETVAPVAIAQKPETHLPSKIMSRSRQSYDQNFRTSSSPKSEHNTHMHSDDSGSKLNSMSSISSIGSSAAHSTRRSNRVPDVKKSIAQSPVAQWGLPEIEENGVFGPEIFAQDLDDDLDQSSSSPGFGESTFGMISSGRDVDFNADTDTLSDAASACPPDIGRYRNEEDTAPPQFVSRLKSEDNRAPSPGLLSNKSKKGFLSRLKSKRSWM